MSKIPEQASCVFKGIIFDTYQWEQKIYNGQTKTFEMLKRADTVNIIPLKEGYVYFNEQIQPHLNHKYNSLFGGRVEPNEEAENAAHRELKEEAGISSAKLTFFKKFEPISKIDWTIYFYIAHDFKFGSKNLDGGEEISVKKLPIDTFIDTIILEKNIEGVQSLCLPLYAEDLRRNLKCII